MRPHRQAPSTPLCGVLGAVFVERAQLCWARVPWRAPSFAGCEYLERAALAARVPGEAPSFAGCRVPGEAAPVAAEYPGEGPASAGPEYSERPGFSLAEYPESPALAGRVPWEGRGLAERPGPYPSPSGDGWVGPKARPTLPYSPRLDLAERPGRALSGPFQGPY